MCASHLAKGVKCRRRVETCAGASGVARGHVEGSDCGQGIGGGDDGNWTQWREGVTAATEGTTLRSDVDQ